MKYCLCYQLLHWRANNGPASQRYIGFNGNMTPEYPHNSDNLSQKRMKARYMFCL